MLQGMRRRINPQHRDNLRKPPLLIAGAALLLQVIAWAYFAPAMATGRPTIFCNVAEHAGHEPTPPASSTVNTDHCALCLLAQGLNAAPAPVGIAVPREAVAPAPLPAFADADYVGWFLGTLQARAPPPVA
jgi:hypothetical protein